MTYPLRLPAIKIMWECKIKNLRFHGGNYSLVSEPNPDIYWVNYGFRGN